MLASPKTAGAALLALVAGAATLAIATFGADAEEGRAIPAPAQDSRSVAATAILAGGCFWGVQGVFQHVDGVTNAVSGYAGGDKGSANYEAVSGGRTRHAEAVRITFDPAKISYGRILQIYFSVAHDPTQLNRQGPDSGTQYRSAIFPADAAQAEIAKGYIAQLDQAAVFPRRIATKIETGHAFYPAEAYHQDYMIRNPTQPYIAINDLPKVDSLKRFFPTAFRSTPVLVASN